MKPKIRKAKRTDSKEILRLIKELAVFEKLVPPEKKAQERLINSAFKRNPNFKILVAELEGKLIGYAFYYFTYSTFLAKQSLFLEDIYIMEKFRSMGAGKLFFEELIEIAKKKGCGRMEWIVLDWNKNAIKFYNKLGAKHLKEWNFYRMELI